MAAEDCRLNRRRRRDAEQKRGLLDLGARFEQQGRGLARRLACKVVSRQLARVTTRSAETAVRGEQLVSELQGLTKVYDMDDGRDISVLMDEGNSSGSGNDDYAVLVPVSNFAGYDPAKDYVYLFVQMGAAGGDTDGDGAIGDAPKQNNPGDSQTWVVNGGFHEWNIQKAVIIQGTKFLDANGDGIQNNGEAGMSGVTIYIDNDLDGIDEATDGNGVLDPGEQFDITDQFGNYSFGGIPLLGGNYTIEINEVVPPGTVPTTDLPITLVIDSRFEAGVVLVVDAIGNRLLQPSIAITKTASLADSGDCADQVNDVINYVIEVTNNGELDIHQVVVSDPFADAPG